jgi:exodeoxyribonuclease V gamma subunit
MTVTIAESTLPLLEQMAAALATCRDPWARHWLVLPGSGRSEWLLRCWARRAGAAAHSQVVPLRSVIEQVACAGGEAFSRERLVLGVAQSLATCAGSVPLPANTDCAVVDSRVLAWSHQLADAIDGALLCREGERRWAHSPFLAELVEHPSVDAALVGHLGTLERQAFRAATERWLEQWSERGGIPRLWIQLDAGLPRVLMRCLADLVDLLADRVHLSLLSPSHSFWGDLRIRRSWTEGSSAGPILTSFGRQTQDLHNQSIDYFMSEGSGGQELPSPTTNDSLLGLIQAACRAAATPEMKRLVDLGDNSFTIHACRSPLRELEICRDRILQAMAEDVTLGIDDVLVLLADPSLYAPLAGAALAPLPVRVLGLGALVSPVASGLRCLLKSLSGRLGLADVQALMDEPLIAERFGFTGVSSELLTWLEQAQFRWGLDEQHRAEAQGSGERRWNLAFALRRLSLGAVVTADAAEGIVDGDVPLERATGLSTALLAQLAQFATLLYAARQDWLSADTDGARTMPVWCERLTSWCEQFLGDGQGVVNEERTQLINTLIPNLEHAAPAGLLLRSDAVLGLVETALDSLTGARGSGAGGITVADLHHYAGTPTRMLLVAGLGAETFPRHEDRPGWHPLTAGRELGDPDRREADRHALLLALLSASDRVVLAYQGGSDEDGRECPPSTPLADLLAAVDEIATLPQGKSVAQNILIRHGLNGFSPNACAAQTRPVARSQLASDYAGATALLEPHRGDYRGLWAQALAPSAHRQPLILRDLSDVLQEPCRIFVRRLGLRVPEEAAELSQADALQLDSLARWSVRDRLLQCRLAGGDEERLRARIEVAGERPRGQYGDALWQQSLAALPAIDESELAAITEPLQLELSSRTLIATLPDGWFRTSDGTVVYCSVSTRSRKRLLNVTLGLLCLAAAESAKRVETWFSKDKKAKVLTAPDAAQAVSLLEDLCCVYQLAQCLPLPFWPQAYDRMRHLEENARKNGAGEIEPQTLLTAAWTTWTEGANFGLAGPPERSLPATRVCFRGLDDPFTWAPKVVDPLLPASDLPLAWRLYCFFSRWESAARGPA